MSEPNAPVPTTPAPSPEFVTTLCNVLASQRDEAASRGAEYLARAMVAEKALGELREQLAGLKKRVDEFEPATEAPPIAA